MADKITFNFNSRKHNSETIEFTIKPYTPTPALLRIILPAAFGALVTAVGVRKS